MLRPLQPRTSGRHAEPRRLYGDQQAYEQQQGQLRLETARALRQVAATVEPADSDYGDMEDEAPEVLTRPRRGQENIEPWSQQLRDVHPPACSFIAIALPPRSRRSQTLTELSYLQMFLDPTLVDTFVTNTNKFATLRGAVEWTEVTTEEMWRYLAVRIRQGIVKLPTLHMYWQHSYTDRYISELMPRNRFMQLHRYWHISEPVPRGQKQTVVEKVTEFYHQCQRLFDAYYQAGQHFAIDETMIRFQGRSYWITVIKNKPTPVGYKLFTVASEGYLMAFRIYRGKGGYDQPQNVLASTVLELVKPWYNSNRTLFMDNLYTSPTLCDSLLAKGIRSCGTCRPNRAGLPPGIKAERSSLPKDETRVWQRGQLGCLLWNDSKPVLFLSTHLRVDQQTAIPATHHRPGHCRPTAAVDYNYNKGHVDQVDQLRSYNVVQRRTRRSWPALAWWLLDTCISNAYKLWCMDNNKKPGLLHFREQLLEQIAAAYPGQHTRVHPTAPAVVHRGWVGHWPASVEGENVCVHCSQGKRKRKRTQFECKVCRVRLHPDKCFGAYHDRLGIDNVTV